MEHNDREILKQDIIKLKCDIIDLIDNNEQSRLRRIAPDCYNEEIYDEADDTRNDLHKTMDHLLKMVDYLYDTMEVKHGSNVEMGR